MSNPHRQINLHRLPQLPGRRWRTQAAGGRTLQVFSKCAASESIQPDALRNQASRPPCTCSSHAVPLLDRSAKPSGSSVKSPSSSIKQDPKNAAGQDAQDSTLRFLDENPEFLDHYVSLRVGEERLEQWLIAKKSWSAKNGDTFPMTPRSGKRPLSSDHASSASSTDSLPNRWAASHPPAMAGGDAVTHFSGVSRSGSPQQMKNEKPKGKERRQHIQKLIKNIHEKNTQVKLLEELTASVCMAIAADGHSLHLVNHEAHTLACVSSTPKSVKTIGRSVAIRPASSVAGHVAYSKQSVKLIRPVTDAKYPAGALLMEEGLQSLLAQPILDADDNVMGVAEFYRFIGNAPFTDYDEQVVLSFSAWAPLLSRTSQLHSDATKQKKMNEFLLAVTKNIFEDIVSMDTVMMKIMDFAKKLVKADRASLFLLDVQSSEVYARIFDTGSIACDTNPSSREIRFPIDKGVAGFVASTGQTLNIEDAYGDKRFNREVDLQTGYTTKTILCMPIRIRGAIMGVVQMVNKQHGPFTKADEEAFETFAVYCGLALHHAKLYEMITKSEQKYKVALEVLTYHNQCSEEEFVKLHSTTVPDCIPDIHRLDFSPWSIDKDDKSLYVVYMFKDLLTENHYSGMFNMSRLAKFTLTVRKNYRKVPYHNWDHAFSVAHAMYAILKTKEHKFTSLESLGLFVACLCHDLDHRGKTNSFMVKSESPLAAVYTTSVMEHHHFNQTVSIMQQDGHEIFKDLSSEDYKTVLRHIKECILATDLALFFGNKAKLKEHVDSGKFNWDDEEHRRMLMFHAMTAADLCSMYKPWQTCWKLAHIIMEEFWQQGDEEKAKGMMPIAMMDRNKADQLPQSQVGFIIGICLPCYELLVQIIPSTKPMVDGASNNLRQWRELTEKYEQSKAAARKDEIDFSES